MGLSIPVSIVWFIFFHPPLWLCFVYALIAVCSDLGTARDVPGGEKAEQKE